MSEESASTPSIDRHLAVLTGLIGEDGNYATKRDELFPEEFDPTATEDPRESDKFAKYLERTSTAADELIRELRASKPITGVPDEDEKSPWTAGGAHDGMVDISMSLLAQTQVLYGEVGYDFEVLKQKKLTTENNKQALKSLGQELLQTDGVQPTGDEKTQEKELETSNN